jgi:hypothetical protein
VSIDVVVCSCASRRRETTLGDFRFDGKRDGWVYRYRDTEAPNAHNVLWRTCPYCGELLPGTSCVADVPDEEPMREATRKSARTEGEESTDGC